jgi:copper chaperone CopZ
MIEEITVSIPRMNCSGCLKKVTNTLQALPSVSIIATDLPAKTLQVRYDPEHTSIVHMKTALEQAHYPCAEETPLMQTPEETSTITS